MKIIKWITLLGLLLLFYCQFLIPSFSGDEIALGNNLKNKSIWELFFPLNTFQSAPPLYLITQKVFLMTLPLPFWINIKILNFLIGLMVLWFVNRIAVKKHTEWGYLSIFWVVLFSLNPYVVYNVLTVKQYGFDLLGMLVLLSEFDSVKKGKRGAWYFGLWSLYSNVGLFVTAAFLIYIFFKYLRESGNLWESILVSVRMYSAYLAGPILYIGYFIWFMQQKGALELQAYMQDYWHWGFFPMNSGVFGFGFMFLRLLGIYFFTSYMWIVYPSLILVFIGLYVVFRKKAYLRDEFILVALLGMLIHVSMSFMHIYPLADRLYLYWIPIFYWFFINGLSFLKVFSRYLGVLVMILFVAAFINNSPFKVNDVVAIYRYLEIVGVKQFYVSDKANKEMCFFNNFTDSFFMGNKHYTVLENENRELEGSFYFVSQVNPRFGHKNETAGELESVKEVITKYRMKKVYQSKGYNVYISSE